MSRPDPLDEALRLWALLTTAERVAFLASIAAPRRELPAPPDPAAERREERDS